MCWYGYIQGRLREAPSKKDIYASYGQRWLSGARRAACDVDTKTMYGVALVFVHMEITDFSLAHRSLTQGIQGGFLGAVGYIA